MQLTWRTVVGGLVVLAALGGGVAVVQRQRSQGSMSEALQPTSAEVQHRWQAGVQGVIQAYKQDGNPTKARDQLLALRVPAEKRDQHLALVLALEAFIQQRKDAETRWQEAVAQFSGL